MEQVWNDTYDEQGRALTTDRPQVYVEWTYEDEANPELSTSISIDTNKDGSFERVIRQEYDEWGNLIGQRVDDGDDGNDDLIFEARFAEDGTQLEFRLDGAFNGDQITEQANGTWNVDVTWRAAEEPLEWRLAQGENTYVELWVYGEDGRLTSRTRDGAVDEQSMITEGADGALDYAEAHTYGEGTWRIDWDQDGDGEADSYSAFTVDASDNPLSLEYFPANGEVAELRWTATYDANGNQLTYEQDGTLTMDFVIGTAADGEVDLRITRTFDEDSNPTSVEQDGNIEEGVIVEAADGQADSRQEVTYDEHGNATGLWVDEDGDGVWERSGTGTLHCTGEGDALQCFVDSIDADLDGDQANEYSERMTYDEHDNLLSEVIDVDADGSPEFEARLQYAEHLGQWRPTELQRAGELKPDAEQAPFDRIAPE
ncbi:MAG: hypothetical protein GY913_14260, partial [Proteobacteria bacterium]|nr:hypothetical protein [Pseudomonadota bacterium]